MGFRKKHIFKTLKSVCSALGLFALAGCAANDVAVDNELKPKARAEGSDVFSTKGNPTKIIETPWGPRSVFDPLRDNEVNAIFKKWYLENKYAIVDYYEYLGQAKEWGVFLDAEALQSLDLKRAGCESVIQSNGFLESSNQLTDSGLNKRTQLLYFTKDCKKFHNFGSLQLSECEEKNKSLLPRSKIGRHIYNMRRNGEQISQVAPQVAVEKADIKISEFQKERGVRYVPSDGIKNEVLGPSSGKSYKQQLYGIFKQSCEKWRGSKPHESLPLENGFTLFDHYPDEPLAPIQFQTPIYRDYIQRKQKDQP